MQIDIDYTTVEAVPYKKTVAYINNFIINTTQFLNRFNYLCEKKLNEVSNQIQRLEITMSILEVKLASIPGIEGDAPPPQQQQQQQPQQQAPVENVGAPPPPPPPMPGAKAAAQPAQPIQQEQNVGLPPPPPAESSGLTMKDDPRYSKYFKMLRMGIVVQSIQQKMMMEGIDPNILDHPDDPSDFSENQPAAPQEEDDNKSDGSNDSDESQW
eukprot:TRINITY_DN2138_c0_g1_i1.p1 TRINITY_DN2138_c0_g1~~TRINITY_DN2138_c0_g1_i1.p1  ORF type:complete len:212 (+),score=72.08 TRINITY_DN2138_c0_g1_i1:295-930(+)